MAGSHERLLSKFINRDKPAPYAELFMNRNRYRELYRTVLRWKQSSRSRSTVVLFLYNSVARVVPCSNIDFGFN